jgi:hypothetical protein
LVEEFTDMAHRKSLIQVKFRLRQDILRSLEREAKRHDRSTNDEIARRLERSLEQDQTERNRAGVEELLQAQMASMPKEQIGGALVGLAAVGGPVGRRASMAAIATEEGKAAALDWLSREAQQKEGQIGAC